MSGEVLAAAAAAAAAARSLDELLLSHDVIFPALFNSRLSTQFVEKHERLQRSPKAGRERGARARGGRWAPHTLPGQTKADTSGRGCCSRCCCGSPGTTDAPPGGVGAAAEGALCCAAGGGGSCAGRARAAPRGSIRGGLCCGGRGSEGTTRHYGSGRRDAAPSGLRRHRSNLAEGRPGGRPAQVPPRNRCGRRAAGAQPRPGPSAPRSAQSQPARSAAHARWGGGGRGTCRPRGGMRLERVGQRESRAPSCVLQGTPHTERGKEMATGTDGGLQNQRSIHNSHGPKENVV
ncbi:uncharacterized protein LOC106629412 [Zonotrichia albicollis]|uniref:uncharacterized protein LOC106629412 n=1 Tax=Zonotrichia albicollis TaxID=44394 RepID=UPI003D80B3AB